MILRDEILSAALLLKAGDSLDHTEQLSLLNNLVLTYEALKELNRTLNNLGIKNILGNSKESKDVTKALELAEKII